MSVRRRWGLALLLAAVGAAAVLVCLLARRESRWHVGFDVTNWRIYGSDKVEFHPDGRIIRSCKTYHLGPLFLSCEGADLSQSTAALLATNAIFSTPLSSHALMFFERQVRLVEVVESHTTKRTNAQPVKAQNEDPELRRALEANVLGER